MRDWLLAVVVVAVAQITGVNAIDPIPFAALLAVSLTALGVWFWVFPRLPRGQALTLEAWMNAFTALAALALVAVSGGPESPYVFFYALLIVFIAAFVERANVRIALIALSSVCALAPIAYDWDGSVESNFIPTIVVAVAVWLVVAALIAWKRGSTVNAELEARRLSYVDQLTGAANRRAIEQYARDLQELGLHYTLVIVRVGGIDEINRALGHFIGDQALRRITQSMRDASLDVDQVSRLAGAEFAVVLPGGDLAAGERWCARFHERLEIANAASIDGARVSARAGCASSTQSGNDFNDVLAAADEDSRQIGGPSVIPPGVPASPSERAERLREQMVSQAAQGGRSVIESVDAPTSAVFAIPLAIAFGAALAVTGGASSILLSLAILIVAYFATFGNRAETILATVTTMLAGLVAVLLNTPVSSIDQTRTLTIAVTLAVLADTIQRNSRQLANSERRAAELSLIDPLTGLPNRTAFERDLLAMLPRNATAHPSRELRLDGPPAVVALDMADFHTARARLGHAGGDLLLVEIAESLRDALVGVGDAYRIGSDEYATIIRAHHMQHVDVVGALCADALRGLDSDGRFADQGLALDFRIGGAIWLEGMTAADLAAAAISEQSAAAPASEFAPVPTI
jgi:diguanylate cyclase (GGDEF)-like protein